LVAAVFMALPYAHYAYSRAGLSHLAHGIYPFLIGCLVILSTQPAKRKWPFAALLCGISLLVMVPTQPGWYCKLTHRCIVADVGGSKLFVSRYHAGALLLLKKLNAKFASGDRSFVVAPYWPGAYAVLRKKSPMWEIFPIRRYSQSFQEKEIQRIKAANPGFALIIDTPLDGRDELRYRNTHPFIDQYIRRHFDRVKKYVRSPDYRIYKSRRKQDS